MNKIFEYNVMDEAEIISQLKVKEYDHNLVVISYEEFYNSYDEVFLPKSQALKLADAIHNYYKEK